MSAEHDQNSQELKNADLESSQGRPLNVRTTTSGGHTADDTQPALPNYHRKLANPTPLGLCAFASTLFLLSLINLDARGLAGKTSLLTSLGCTYGGAALFAAGMWEMVTGNSFAAVVFTSYSCFWLSYSVIQIPWFAATAGYTETELADVIGLYLATWTMLTVFFLLACLRSSIALVSLMVMVVITLIMLTAYQFTLNTSLQKAGGAFGLISALIGYYTALCGLFTPETTLFTLPAGSLAPSS